MNRYHDRVVAITGAAQGLGLAMAARFAAEGATVALADVNEKALADAASAISTAHQTKLRTDVVDVTDSSRVDSWIGTVVADFERVDVLVNNAGIIRDNRVEDITDDDWHAVMNVSLTGSFHCTRAAFGPMKRQGYGRIVSQASMSWRGNFGQANCVAAKAGIVGMTRTLALEGAQHGITANAIAPRGAAYPLAVQLSGTTVVIDGSSFSALAQREMAVWSR